MSVQNLNRLFQPRSVAVIGASPKQGSVGNTVIRNLIDENFGGEVYLVNPKYTQIDGNRCYGSIQDIGASIDLAILCTPASTIPKLVEECGESGVAGLIVLSAGFREVGAAGKQLEAEVVLAASKYPEMRMVGPNCLGVLVPSIRLNASFGKQLPKPGRIAFVSQSGALCAAILDRATDESIGFSLIASIGNALDVDLGDMIDYLATDPSTEAIVLYVESIEDARKFISAARAFTRTKPIVAYKAGRFSESAKAAASHTGAMVGEDCVYDAAFARAGIVRVNNMSELFGCAEVLARGKLPTGSRLAIVTNAGGPGIMATDALLERNGTLATLSPETIERLNKVLPPNWSHQNPIDIIGDATPDRFSNAVSAALDDDGVDGVVVLLSPQAMTEPMESAGAILTGASESLKPVLAVWMGGESVRKGVECLNQAGIPTFENPEEAVAAFESLVQYSRRREVLYSTPSERRTVYKTPREERRKAFQNKSGLLNEVDSKCAFAAYDIPINETTLARNFEEAVSLSRKYDCPVALKIVSPQITHKTNVGGVILNVQGDAQVADAYRRIVESAKQAQPHAIIEGVSVQPMVVDPNSIEMIVGVKRDPTFGVVLMVGAGGTMAELIRDRVVELPPLNDRIALRMLESMHMWPMLIGYRKRPRANIEKLVETMIRLSTMVTENPEIQELDINPLVVTPSQVVAVDARVVVDTATSNTSTGERVHLAISPYPSHLVKNVLLDNGTHVTLRPIRPEDESKWIELLEGCSPATIHDRFGGLIRQFDHQLAARYCFVDYDRELAMVAEIECDGQKKLIGIGRVIANAERSRATFAMLVADEWKPNGLDSILTDACVDITNRWNIPQLIAETTADNFHTRTILRDREFEEDVGEDGIVVARRLFELGGTS